MMMKRADEGVGFLLRYENVAWYEDGAVRILDRRIYPVRVEYVTCRRHEEVAQAIADMRPGTCRRRTCGPIWSRPPITFPPPGPPPWQR